MMKSKEQAYDDYIKTTEKSWTYERMTDAERDRMYAAFRIMYDDGTIKGTYVQRWGIMQGIYTAFLFGIGYTGPMWREKEVS